MHVCSHPQPHPHTHTQRIHSELQSQSCVKHTHTHTHNIHTTNTHTHTHIHTHTTHTCNTHTHTHTHTHTTYTQHTHNTHIHTQHTHATHTQGGNVSPHIHYSILNVLYAYAYTVRLFNGGHHELPLQASQVSKRTSCTLPSLQTVKTRRSEVRGLPSLAPGVEGTTGSHCNNLHTYSHDQDCDPVYAGCKCGSPYFTYSTRKVTQ